MRYTGLFSVVPHLVVGATALLWLLWYFIPLGHLPKTIITLCAVVLMVGLTWNACYRRKLCSGHEQSSAELPLIDTHEPVVLVCGEGVEALFQTQNLRCTPQGCWLKVGAITRLKDVVRHILARQPQRLGQLSLMYRCLPENHQDEAVLRASINALRQQVRALNQLTGINLPVVISCVFPGPLTPKLIVCGDASLVCIDNQQPVSVLTWQQSLNNLISIPLLSQCFAFIRDTLLDELAKETPLTPPIHPLAVTFQMSGITPDTPSVWTDRLYRQTGLRFSSRASHHKTSPSFTDELLPLLEPFITPPQCGKNTRRLVFVVWFTGLAALCFSIANNRSLIGQISADLQRWHAIPASYFIPKEQSLRALKLDALKLERWHRQGEPMRYSLGYYSGRKLWLSLQRAIDSYSPPTPTLLPIATVPPQTIRLDALSLFDSGKYQLKANSHRVLMDALRGIQAKPGWLIVVTGHTDNTGSAAANQALSLKRAEALRNWMLLASEVPATCFAVQGYGATQPRATNDTVEGREANRRVEISLVPQVDACKEPATQDLSNE